MKFKKTDYIAMIILVATFVHLIVVYPSLPAKIPTNWGFNGAVDYSDKGTIWFMYGINLLIYPLFFVIPKIDPKGGSYKKVEGFYGAFRLVIVTLLAGMLELTILSVQDANRFDVGKIAMIAISLIIIFIGNYLPKCRQSYTLGIKNMWTLADERVWNDTHRMGGVLFVASGVIGLAATLILTEKWYAAITIVLLIGAVVFTSIYSYISYNKYNKK